MQPICSFRSVPHRRFWFVGGLHAAGLAMAMVTAVCLRLGWRDGLDYLQTHHVPASASWGIFVLALGTAGIYDTDRGERPGETFVATAIAVLGGTLLATALLWATSSWVMSRGILLVFAVLALLAALAMSQIHHVLRGLGLLMHRCLVIGTNGEAHRSLDIIRRHPEAG